MYCSKTRVFGTTADSVVTQIKDAQIKGAVQSKQAVVFSRGGGGGE